MQDLFLFCRTERTRSCLSSSQQLLKAGHSGVLLTELASTGSIILPELSGCMHVSRNVTVIIYALDGTNTHADKNYHGMVDAWPAPGRGHRHPCM